MTCGGQGGALLIFFDCTFVFQKASLYSRNDARGQTSADSRGQPVPPDGGGVSPDRPFHWPYAAPNEPRSSEGNRHPSLRPQERPFRVSRAPDVRGEQASAGTPGSESATSFPGRPGATGGPARTWPVSGLRPRLQASAGYPRCDTRFVPGFIMLSDDRVWQSRCAMQTVVAVHLSWIDSRASRLARTRPSGRVKRPQL
jgi:hypothetical protein